MRFIGALEQKSYPGHMYEAIWGSYSGVAEDSNPLGCDIMSLDMKHPTPV